LKDGVHVREKMTVAKLRELHYFDIPTLAQQAGVEVSVVNRILHYQEIQLYQAELVIAALNDVLEPEEEYTLDTLDIKLVLEKGELE
jgi:hypothetical protein